MGTNLVCIPTRAIVAPNLSVFCYSYVVWSNHGFAFNHKDFRVFRTGCMLALLHDFCLTDVQPSLGYVAVLWDELTLYF